MRSDWNIGMTELSSLSYSVVTFLENLFNLRQNDVFYIENKYKEKPSIKPILPGCVFFEVECVCQSEWNIMFYIQ